MSNLKPKPKPGKTPRRKRANRDGGGLAPVEKSRPPAKPRGKPRRAGANDADRVLLYGAHPVSAALANPHRKAICLFATDNALLKLDKAVPEHVRIEHRDTRALSRMVGEEAVHQGLVLECAPLEPLDDSELFQLADARLVLALDEITDPHNAGAILRSAAAFGVDYVLTTHRNRAAQSGVLAKSASGALDMLPMMACRQLAKTLAALEEMGFCIIGLDSAGPAILEESLEQPSRPTVLVMGSEGRGLRHKTRAACTHLARLDMPGAIKSLNVSNAAALSLYIVRRHLDHPR